MKKIGQKEILKAILMEALVIKRKKELFAEAQKINQELKTLNEEIGARTGGFGPGFTSYQGANPVIALATQSQYEPEEVEQDTECGCKLDQFPQLEKDVEGFGSEEQESGDSVEGIKGKLLQLKDEIEQLTQSLNESEEPVDELFGGLGNLFNKGAQKVGQAAQGAGQAIKGAAQGAGQAIKGAAQGAGQAVQGAAQNIKQTYQAGEQQAAQKKAQNQVATIAKQIKSTQQQLATLNQQYKQLTGGKFYSGKAVHKAAEE